MRAKRVCFVLFCKEKKKKLIGVKKEKKRKKETEEKKDKRMKNVVVVVALRCLTSLVHSLAHNLTVVSHTLLTLLSCFE